MGFSLDDDEQSSKIPGASDVASDAEAIIENAPPVSDHINIGSGDDSTAKPSGDSVGDDSGGEKDSAGVAYDPAKHAATKTKNSDGTWKKRRGTGTLGASKKGAKKEAAKVEESAAQLAAKAKMAGQAAAMSQFMVMSSIFGPEWRPLITKLDVPDGLGNQVTVTINEAEEQSELWGNWFLATGRTDFPPGIGLVVGLLAYAGRRATMPETQRRAGKVKEWFVQKIVSWKMRRADKKASKNASNDSRPNAERKDNAGDGARAGISPAR